MKQTIRTSLYGLISLLSWTLCSACGFRVLHEDPSKNTAPTSEGEPFVYMPPEAAPYIDQLDLKVPQNRVRKSLGTIQVRVIRFRPPTPTAPKPPVLYLSGGPGGSIRSTAEYLADQGRGVRLAERWGRDILLLAQRGTEGSVPFLRCANDEFCTKKDGQLHLDPQRYAQAGVDLPSYNTMENAADVADIARALGYTQVVLYGHSYGTILAQRVMQRHPEVVHSAILSGFLDRVRYKDVFDPNKKEEVARIREEALTWYGEACAKNPTCATSAPGWDPRADFRNASAVLTQKPLQIEKRAWTADVFQSWVTQKLQYSPPNVPPVLAFVRALATVQLEQASTLMRYLATLPSTRSPDEPEEDASFADVMYSSTTLFDALQFVLKSSQPSSDYSPEEFSAPFVSTGKIPTLFLVGGLDRQTPAAWAREDHKKFTPFQYVEFPCANHSSRGELQIEPVRTTTCGASLVASFLQNPQKPVDTSCVKPTCDAVATQFAVDFSNTLQLMSLWP